MSIFKAIKQYSELILNPFLLALLATFLVLLIFSLQFPKYTTEKILTQKLYNDAFYQYEDLDGDGNSEKIGAFHNSIGIAAVTVNRNGSAITQINLHGTFNFGKKKGRIMFGDRDSDGWKEIYIFTLAHDTVLLHCIERNFELNPAITNKFVA